VQATELTYLSISEAGGLFRSGRLSPVELTRALLDRAAEQQETLHSFVTLTPELALQEARAAEAAFQQGDERLTASPLLGIPVGYKDIVTTRGIRTTAGSGVHFDWVPETDAAVVERWRGAGAVTLGKLMTHEFAIGLQSPAAPLPAARNPWNPEHIPGGSSSGSGAALAAGQVLGAIGSDTGGSIRGPASFCGISGLKPTYGLVSRRGVVTLSWSLDHVGPMACSVEDLAPLLQAMAGHDPADPASANVPLPNYAAALAQGARGLRIGVPTNYFFEGAADEVRAAVLAAADALAEQGAELRGLEVPNAELAPAVSVIMLAEAYAYHARDLAEVPEKYDRRTRNTLRRGALYSAAEYVQAQRARRIMCESFAEVMRRDGGVDLLLTPASPEPAPVYDKALESGARRSRSYTGAFNMTGLPSLVVPCGFSSAGLPIGLMLSGRPFEDATVLRAGHAYQQATDWHRRRPSPGA
jgi:aspartyl-tRNA(Asn)/glutamyl-tRNA(Gln) amidotransferase subunit A